MKIPKESQPEKEEGETVNNYCRKYGKDWKLVRQHCNASCIYSDGVCENLVIDGYEKIKEEKAQPSREKAKT